MKTSEVQDKLCGVVDTVSKRGDVFTVRRGFFYTHGMSADKLAAAVKATFPGAEVVDSGEQWKPFNGGHTVAQGSHFWVKFKVATPAVELAQAA